MKNEFMLRAVELAKKGEGRVNPNPLVGAVIVKDGRIIGEGYHHKYGELHAERDALKNCLENGENPRGAEIYVTLEPCCHFGKQPPCTQAIVEAGITRVIVGSRDPNPLVHGKGNSYLREHGIEVIEDFLKSECDELNPVFFHFIQTKTPFIALKYAMTLDGKISTKSGKSKWITCEKSRSYVQVLRNKYSAILCGIGTVLSDDPMLNCRLTDESGKNSGRNPVRIICDSNLRIPLESKIVKTSNEIKTIVAYSDSAKNSLQKNLLEEKKQLLEKSGVELLNISSHEKNGKTHLNLNELIVLLGERKIDGVLVEGGSEINYAFLESNLVNKIYAFVSPKIFGGNGKSPVSGEGISEVDEAFGFNLSKITQFEEDVLLEYNK